MTFNGFRGMSSLSYLQQVCPLKEFNVAHGRSDQLIYETELVEMKRFKRLDFLEYI